MVQASVTRLNFRCVALFDCSSSLRRQATKTCLVRAVETINRLIVLNP
jgi:hypothetical protein